MIRILTTPGCSAAWNMAVDEALFNAGGRDPGIITLRIYSWTPPAVSLGYGQDVEDEIDPGQCDGHGIELVRRITGGRAVLHDQELTYSLVVRESHPALGGSSGVMIRRVGEALIGTLRQFGIPGELAPDGHCGMGGKNDVCFTATGRYEITVRGKKLAGNAQRRSGGRVLQHGSILLGPGHRRLPLLMPGHAHARRDAIARLLNERTTSVSELIPRVPSFKEWADRLSRSFLDHLNLEGRMDVLNAEERRMAESLVRTRYGNADWIYRRTLRHVG
ncbi:MAG: biotin/lipoate A/B protein ligase family protein [Gemmatimonadetes bacterium]|nr:biotin/lipoate A/B protein ligase family protein [Gemmatimonadota bacterium]